MHIHISLDDGVPIYRQIVNQIKYQVAAGQLLPDEELPPIRTLAEQLLVTPNTIVRAYGELERDNVVRKRRGAGTYIAGGGSPLAREERRRILAGRADQLLAEARQMNFGLNDILDLLRERDSALGVEASKEAAHG
ncbi:MAG: GntR family transcriptional regulator [FCB group bacterium]|jgi:GntR family transcriptional regulator|nr:GntR family transcriptional regulator [FCB group bacterium]